MKRVLALLVLIASPLLAAPAPWWQTPPEVWQQVQATIGRLLAPGLGKARARPLRDSWQFRDRKGVVWLTAQRIGEEVRCYNRDGALCAHVFRQGRQLVAWALTPDGKWIRQR